MNHLSTRSLSRVRATALTAAGLVSIGIPASAYSDVRFEGDWASKDRPVSLDVSGTPRGRAIEQLAEAGGFSVVMTSPLADLVDVHVKDEPASKVLELLLPDGGYVAKRTGNLVSIRLDAAQMARPPAPPVPALPPLPASTASDETSGEKGEDRRVLGGSMTIAQGEVAHDVAVLGGNCDVYGTVTGDLAVLGGSVHVHDGARVLGQATMLGGDIQVDDGAVMSHEVTAMGGELDHRHEKRGKHGRRADGSGDRDRTDDGKTGLGARAWRAVSDWGDSALGSMSSSALLFAFGTVVVALAEERSRALRVEIASRPMRTLALGIVGCIAAAVIAVALCVTIVGIPIALIGAAAFLLAAYAGVTAALTTAGEALFRHRTTNVYVHLAAGCGMYFLATLVPWVGRWTPAAVFLVGVGVMVATRVAGLVRPPRALGAASARGTV
jgi:hypothetical protein